MKEILTWGADVPKEFVRLGIQAKQTYAGAGLAPSVYEIADNDFAILCADPEENWEGKDAGWRHSEGANTSPDTYVIVNGHEMEGFSRQDADADDDEPEMAKYATLLEHLEQTLGATNGKNVAACAAELATANGCSIGELFAKYQPVELPIKRIPAADFLMQSGLLFEINRRVLHPLGLALEVQIHEDGARLGDLWDYRHDAEGMLYGAESFSLGLEKYNRFMEEVGTAKLDERLQALGFTVQERPDQ